MKEWSNKPSDLVTTSSSPVKTVSSSPVGSTGSSIVKTSGSIVKTSGSSMTLTSGSSSTVTTYSSGAVTASRSVGSKAAMAAALLNPLAVGVAAGTIGAAAYGTSNIIKYKKKQKTGKQAAKDTAINSAGVGISVGLGTAAVNAVYGTSLALGSTVLVPIVVGTGVVYASMKIWKKLLSKATTAKVA